MSRLSARLAWLSLALVACTGPNPDFQRVGAGDARPADASAMADGASEDMAPGEPRDVDAGPTEVNGLRGDYFVGIDFDTPAFSRIDPTIDFAWVHAAPDPRLPEDDFSIRWTGELSPRHSELYTFHVDHDDGVRLWVGGTLVIDSWDQTGQNTQGQIALTVGQRYPIRIEHFDTVLTATMRLAWSSPSQPRQIVPSSSLFTAPLP